MELAQKGTAVTQGRMYYIQIRGYDDESKSGGMCCEIVVEQRNSRKSTRVISTGPDIFSGWHGHQIR